MQTKSSKEYFKCTILLKTSDYEHSKLINTLQKHKFEVLNSEHFFLSKIKLKLANRKQIFASTVTTESKMISWEPTLSIECSLYCTVSFTLFVFDKTGCKCT